MFSSSVMLVAILLERKAVVSEKKRIPMMSMAQMLMTAPSDVACGVWESELRVREKERGVSLDKMQGSLYRLVSLKYTCLTKYSLYSMN